MRTTHIVLVLAAIGAALGACSESQVNSPFKSRVPVRGNTIDPTSVRVARIVSPLSIEEEQIVRQIEGLYPGEPGARMRREIESRRVVIEMSREAPGWQLFQQLNALRSGRASNSPFKASSPDR